MGIVRVERSPHWEGVVMSDTKPGSYPRPVKPWNLSGTS